jgi:hypothetical protein
VDGLAGLLGGRVSSLPLKCLGLPLGVAYKAKHIWDSVIEKIGHRLIVGKRMYLLRPVGLPFLRAHFPIFKSIQL